MSAYIVDRATIHALVHAATSVRDFRYSVSDPAAQFGFRSVKAGSAEADELGQMLTTANVASVSYRYPDDGADTLPGRIDLEWASPYVFPLYDSMRWPQPSPAFVLKQLACFEYQSCERPDWRDSEAHAFCDALRHAMIARLPGYEDAPWGVEEYPLTRRMAVAS